MLRHNKDKKAKIYTSRFRQCQAIISYYYTVNIRVTGSYRILPSRHVLCDLSGDLPFFGCCPPLLGCCLPFVGMDDKISYPLVVLPPAQGTLVPVLAAIEDADDSGRDEPDARAWAMFFWRRFCQLAVLFFRTLALVRLLQLQISELRQQACYWRGVTSQRKRPTTRSRTSGQDPLSAEMAKSSRSQATPLRTQIWKRPPQRNRRRPRRSRPVRTKTASHANERGQQPGSNGHGRRKRRSPHRRR